MDGPRPGHPSAVSSSPPVPNQPAPEVSQSPIGKRHPLTCIAGLLSVAPQPALSSRTRPQLSYRLPEPLVHQEGGTEGVQRILEKCEVVGAPEQRTPLQHHSLDHRTS